MTGSILDLTTACDDWVAAQHTHAMVAPCVCFQIAGAAENDPQNQVFGGTATLNPAATRSKDPVSPLSPAEEQLWKDYAQVSQPACICLSA